MSELLAKTSAYPQILASLHRQACVAVEGAWGSSAAMLAAAIWRQTRRPVLFVTAHVDEADDVEDDARLLGAPRAVTLPAYDTASWTDQDRGAEVHARRCAVLGQVLQAAEPPFLVASIASLVHNVPAPEVLAAQALELVKGRDIAPDALMRWLDKHSYQRTEMVEVPGDYARRGGILDIFPIGWTDAVRVEFFGDTVESVRRVDLADQQGRDDLKAVRLTSVPPRPAKPGAETTHALSYLPADAIVVLREPSDILEIGRSHLEKQRAAAGLFTPETLLAKTREFTRIEMTAFARHDDAGAASVIARLRVEGLPAFPREPSKAAGQLRRLAAADTVLVYADAPAEAERLQTLLDEHPAPAGAKQNTIKTLPGFLHSGFRLPDAGTVLVGLQDIFHRGRNHPVASGRSQLRPIDSFVDLQPGDYVVHVNHGIGRFKGLTTIRRTKTGEEGRGRAEEVLVIEYAGNSSLQVPVDQINLVQKYIGGFRGAPVLNKIGGTAWEKQKQKVAEAVTDLALDLLAVQAERRSKPGLAYPPATPYFHEFEAAFPHAETPDQLRAVAEIGGDLEAPRPMDRLLCGDVGFGKTEMAIRAAFRAAEFGKQVAVLVPTTVLAEQHGRTFAKRFDGFPFRVESLSRFRTAKEQREILAELRAGRIDIIIGTHRLLGKDVAFKDLGLVIIDEEQRFGVEHKEKLKIFRRTVDVLTLTATPIPRTLHMTMLGIRDISSLATPPADRRSVYTEVTRWSEEKIKHAIERELERGGQCYFVHNRVYDIQSVADDIFKLVPQAKIGIGHGQMGEGELEEVMLKFINKEYDILVSTTIIESGLDISNANTMFIHDADMFGLADLHQLRGRVGRDKNRAYCYLLLPRERPLAEQSRRRLKAIEDYSELGAGFRIAMRDLEIRGAGNILGPEQSGHIASVGYEMYCRLLEDSVDKLRKTPKPKKKEARIDLGVDGFLPKTWIESDRQRMEAYRRITRCQTVPELEDLAKELADRFGALPPTARAVVDVNELRIRAGDWGITAMSLHKSDVIITMDDLAVAGPLFAKATGSVRIADATTIHLRMPPTYLEPATLLPILRRMLSQPRA